MTEPTDAEIDALWRELFSRHDHSRAALVRAALAKWGPPAQAADSAGRDADRIEKWSDRIQRAHPKSEPEFWPDALRVKYMADEISDLRVKYMADEISDLRAARATADSVTAPAVGYPPLPRVGAIGYASVVDIDSYAKTLTIGPHLPGVRDIALWTTDQMHAYADETYALRIGAKHA